METRHQLHVATYAYSVYDVTTSAGAYWRGCGVGGVAAFESAVADEDELSGVLCGDRRWIVTGLSWTNRYFEFELYHSLLIYRYYWFINV